MSGEGRSNVFFLFQPFRTPGLLKYFLIALVLLAGVVFMFIRPGKLEAGDFMLIAWYPGRELLETGSVYAEYPYPLWTVVVMLPFVLWAPQTAMLLMLVCNVVMFAVSLALLAVLLDWEMTPAAFVLLVFLAGLFLPVLTSLWIGQLTLFSLLVLLLTLYFYRHERWGWLGVMLGLSFIKPQVMLLLAGLLLLWALWQRRWRVLFGFGAVIIVLSLISLPFISSPSQLIGGGIGSHLGGYIMKTSTLWGLALNLGASWILPLVISLGLLMWVGWIWLPFLRGDDIADNRVTFLFSAAMMVNLIVIPYSWMHNLALLLLPMSYVAGFIMKMKGAVRWVWLILLVLLMHTLMVVLFITPVITYHRQAYQIIPALLLLPLVIFFEFKFAVQRI